MFLALKEARRRGFYDEYPMLSQGIDPQLYMSRNDRLQPFWLTCANDTVLVQLTGKADIAFKKADVERFHMRPGDLIYVPAGVPHRLDPQNESIHLRYKAAEPGFEAVAWYCEHCGTELDRETWDANREISQSHYLSACESFNADRKRRTCGACGAEHPVVDIVGNQWADIAAELLEERTVPAA